MRIENARVLFTHLALDLELVCALYLSQGDVQILLVPSGSECVLAYVASGTQAGVIGLSWTINNNKRTTQQWRNPDTSG